jgi:L-malate glycosyltransferase
VAAPFESIQVGATNRESISVRPLHIALVGHVAGEHVAEYLQRPVNTVPTGYTGAPLTGILIGELLRLGHRVTAITTDSSLPLNGGPVTLEHGSFRFVVCPARRRAWRNNGFRLGRAVDGFLFERRQVGAAIRDAQPDIVHAHWSYEFALAAIAQPFPHLITCHDSPTAVLRLTRSMYRAIRWLMAQRVFSTGTHFSTVSEYMAEVLSPSLRNPPIVIPNPVAPQAIKLGKARSKPIHKKVALVANGWGDIKNTSTALEGFAKWRKHEPDATLWLFGTDHGPGQAAEQWATNRGLTRGVEFVGNLPHATLLQRLDEMDALLHPSKEESFGVAVAEAMAMGLPIIAGRKSGAVPWVVGANSDLTSDCALLVDVESSSAIAINLKKVFDENYSKKSAAARVRALNIYAAPSVTAKYVARYLQIIPKSAFTSIKTAAAN